MIQIFYHVLLSLRKRRKSWSPLGWWTFLSVYSIQDFTLSSSHKRLFYEVLKNYVILVSSFFLLMQSLSWPLYEALPYSSCAIEECHGGSRLMEERDPEECCYREESSAQEDNAQITPLPLIGTRLVVVGICPKSWLSI